MAEQDDIIQFNEGDKLTIEETNHNNLLLKGWALDNSASEAYINTKMAELSTSLNASITSINTQISTLNNQVGNKLSATTDINTNGKGAVLLSNGLLLQYTYVDIAAGKSKKWTANFKKSFKDTHYMIAGAWSNAQVAGDKQMNWYIDTKNNASVILYSQLEGTNGDDGRIYLIAMGRG